MRLKLPFTEQFLWDLYNFKNKTKDVIGKIIPERGGLRFSDFNTFRDEWTNENKKKREREKSKRRFAGTVCKLKSSGYLKTLRAKDKSAVIITSKGFEKLFITKLKLTDNNLRKDRKWQMVLFDISESRRKDRDWFRRGLKYLGYKKMQQSIWVCQYDTEKETKELIEQYNLKSFVDFLLVKKVRFE
ncbi:MAG: hypothetical protein V1686_02230 [Patescibacteria group bacterium]